MEIHQQVIKILQQVMQVLQQVMEISLFHTQGSVSPSAATKTDIVFQDGGLPTGEWVVPYLDAPGTSRDHPVRLSLPAPPPPVFPSMDIRPWKGGADDAKPSSGMNPNKCGDEGCQGLPPCKGRRRRRSPREDGIYSLPRGINGSHAIRVSHLPQ